TYRYHLSCILFFFIIRPSLTSTLFPYTTLFRSCQYTRATTAFSTLSLGLLAARNQHGRIELSPIFLGCITGFFCIGICTLYPARSEEHTSELQSRFDLVCRLLLEKKKIYMRIIN